MLESLTLTSFKAYGPSTVVHMQPFTLLVGPNGAGKSTILQAIDLLGGIVRSTLPEHVATHQWDYADLPHLLAANAEISIAARLRFDDVPVEWSVTLGKRRRMGIARELVVRDPDKRREILLQRAGRTMARTTSDGHSEKITQTLTASWLGALDPLTAADQRRFPVLCQVADWARRIRGHFFLSPDQLRAPAKGDPESIGPSGEGLAPFLAALRRRNPKGFNRLVRQVHVHYPRLAAIEPKRGQFGWTRLEIEERWNGEHTTLNARQVSDGLLRLIAVAAMHAAEPRTSVLLLDEIENGLHPQLLGNFIEMLQELAPETQVVATTHSPVAVSFVRDAAGVVIVDRGAGGHPHCVPLTESKNYAKLRPHFDPGELWYNLGEEKLVR